MMNAIPLPVSSALAGQMIMLLLPERDDELDQRRT